MQTITVTIDQEGNPTIAVSGVKGRSCKDVTAAVEKALGKSISDTPTEEMHHNANAKASR